MLINYDNLMLVKKILKTFIPKNLLAIRAEYYKRKRNMFMDEIFLSYTYKKKLGFIKNLKNIEILILGSSHADDAIFTKNNKNLFNLGLTSSDIYLSYKLYEKYSSEMNKLKNLIFFCSVFSPGFSLIKTEEKYRLVAYKYFFEIPYQENEIIDKKIEKLIINNCKKIKEIKINEDYRGYSKKNSFITNMTVEERVKTHLRENRRQPNQLKWLKKFIEIVTTEDNRSFYIVIPPAKKSYIECLPNKYQLFDEIYNMSDCNIVIIDFYDSPLFDDSDFGDFDHLNENGAKKITIEILKRIEIDSLTKNDNKEKFDFN